MDRVTYQTYLIILCSTEMATNSSLASVLGVLFVFTLFHNPITVIGQNIPQVALFTFGDSNFDAGNKKFLTNVSLPQNFWPYGKSIDDPNGKFSDGKIVPDFIGKLFSPFLLETTFFFFLSEETKLQLKKKRNKTEKHI